jgi:hypothetical protein
MGMELHLSVTESAGRLTGTAHRSNGEETIAFSGALELLACIERLCLPQATPNPSSTTQDH